MLRYTFERINLFEGVKGNKCDVYIDTVTSPVKYRVMTMKFVVDKNSYEQGESNFDATCKDLEFWDTLWVQNKLPILYTKFAFMLQVSGNYALSIAVFRVVIKMPRRWKSSKLHIGRKSRIGGSLLDIDMGI